MSTVATCSVDLKNQHVSDPDTTDLLRIDELLLADAVASWVPADEQLIVLARRLRMGRACSRV